MTPSPFFTAFSLTPQYRDYVWGGHRLRPDGSLTAEAWVVYENDLVASGPLAGRTLAELSAEYGAALLGQNAVRRTGTRFPLLIKLLDCAGWLSLQVHPDDEKAVQLEGPGVFGKTEAWHFIESGPGSEILAGVLPGTSPQALAQAICHGGLLDHMQHLAIQPGNSIFIRAGMIHALGPGLLVYEVQQTSDFTYRVFDWDRPATANRPLHIEKSLAAANPALTGQLVPPPPPVDGSIQNVIACEHFLLDVLFCQGQPIRLDPQGQTFYALTLIEGQASLAGPGWQLPLRRFETALIPAACPACTLSGSFKALRASVP